jgi:beta-lactam-binding protein with PASTA domain
MDQDEINEHIRWRNRIEQVVKGKKSKLLVPDIVGLPEQEAKNMLAGEQIAVGKIVKSITNTQPIGNVVAQKPVAGTEISQKTSVQLEVEAVPVEVPSLIGIDRTTAIDMLRQSGLTVGDQEMKITGDFPVDAIIRQDPQPGVVVPEDSSVNLWIEAESVLIPYVEGMPVEQAREVLRNGRLRIKEREDVRGVAEVGTVLGQDPGADTRVPPNTEVKLSVEAGVRVPDVVGQWEKDAINTLQQNQLSAGRIEWKITGNAREYTVLDQDPRAGEVAKVNSAVKLVIEAESVTVPNMTGLSIQQAEDRLRSQGLSSESREELKGTARIGTVLRQEPQAGTLVEPGKAIRLYVEAGVQVPNVVKMSVQKAMTLLRSKGFTSVSPREDVQGQTSLNTVLRQNPQAGRAVKPDRTTVTLYYEAGVRVPDVRNLTVNSAESKLRSAGFGTRRDYRETSQYRADTVMGQSPSPNSAAKPNSSVTLVVAKAPQLRIITPAPLPVEKECQVPRVIDLRLNVAIEVLERAGFRLGRVWDIHAPNQAIQDYHRYSVEQQNPGPGYRAPCNSSVDLGVAYIVY